MLGPEATNGNISGKALRKTVFEARVIRCRNQLSQQQVRALSEVFEDGISIRWEEMRMWPRWKKGVRPKKVSLDTPSPGMLPSLIPHHQPWLHSLRAEHPPTKSCRPKGTHMYQSWSSQMYALAHSQALTFPFPSYLPAFLHFFAVISLPYDRGKQRLMEPYADFSDPG